MRCPISTARRTPAYSADFHQGTRRLGASTVIDQPHHFQCRSSGSLHRHRCFNGTALCGRGRLRDWRARPNRLPGTSGWRRLATPAIDRLLSLVSDCRKAEDRSFRRTRELRPVRAGKIWPARSRSRRHLDRARRARRARQQGREAADTSVASRGDEGEVKRGKVRLDRNIKLAWAANIASPFTQ